jgi:ubiquinone/menaquinone biosynthesis C-methylase UbiE
MRRIMRSHVRTVSWLAACAAVIVVSVQAQQPGVHPVSGRVFAQTMGVEGAAWLERRDRDVEEDTSLAVRLLGLKKGWVVADVGAGSGYYTLRMAKAVGDAGKVYANDLQPGMIEILQKNVEKAKLTNVVPVLGSIDDPKLPAESLDMILMVDVYHEFSRPQQMLRKMREALKPGGRLVLLEYRAEDPNVPIRPEHKMTKAQVKQELEAEGFKQSRVYDDLPWQHLFVFTKP